MDLQAMAKEFAQDWGLTTETMRDLEARLIALESNVHNSALFTIRDQLDREERRGTGVVTITTVDRVWLRSILDLHAHDNGSVDT